MSLVENINKFREKLKSSDCRLIAVSKTKPPELILEAYQAGLKDFGENRAQELSAKQQELPEDIKWHMIGHLQRNKVKYLAPYVYLIHSVDNLKLLREINKQGGKVGRIIPCLLQVHIAQEEAKYGFEERELPELLSQGAFQDLPQVEIRGLMGMATFTEDETQIRKEFRCLKSLFDQLSQMESPGNFHMEELSMGMSNDYSIALEEGATMIRVGSSIFGARD